MSSQLRLNSEALVALEEVAERQRLISAIDASLFKQQLSFIKDKSRLKTAQCTRRAGKSYAAGCYLVRTGIEYAGTTSLYIAPTRAQAKRIMIKDVLRVIDRKFSVGLEFNLTDLEVRFPNGSIAYLFGADSKPEEIEKALGQKYKLVMIDEGGSWRQDQQHMVHSVLEPACADLDGTICMIGSPVNYTRTYFFDITYYKPTDEKYVSYGWSRHKWSWKDNPHIAQKMKAHIQRLIKANPRVVETATFKQQYLNEWIIDDANKVYSYSDTRNRAHALPEGHTWLYGLGLDLGYNDDTAMVVAAWSPTVPEMFFVEVFKRSGMDITAVSEQLAVMRHKYPIGTWIVDGASKQAVEELKRRYAFPLQTADKHGKADFIEMMNSDYTMGRIKLLPTALLLAEEYDSLVWDMKAKAKVEHPACPNHAADGALYIWRKCYHYLSKERVAPIDKDSEDYMLQYWEAQALAAEGRQRADWVKEDWAKEYRKVETYEQ